MHQCLPNFIFGKASSLFDVVVDALQNIAPTGIFHDDVQSGGTLVVEGILVANDILAVETGQDAYFVDCVLPFLFFHGSQLNLKREDWGTFFMAYSLPSSFRLTFQTTPKAPSPSLLSISKSFAEDCFTSICYLIFKTSCYKAFEEEAIQ